MRSKHLVIGLVLLVVATLPACRKQEPSKAQRDAAARAESIVGTRDDVLQALGKASDLSTVTKLVRSAGLEKTLEGIGNYTLFAPTDAAFAKVPESERKRLESRDGRPQLLALLRQHIATGYITQADLSRGLARNAGAASLATMGGAPIRLHRRDDAIFLGAGETGPRILAAPIASRNGMIYRIDQVIPPTANSRHAIGQENRGRSQADARLHDR